MQAAVRAGLPQPSGEGRAQGAIVLRGLQVPAGTTGAITLSQRQKSSRAGCPDSHFRFPFGLRTPEQPKSSPTYFFFSEDRCCGLSSGTARGISHCCFPLDRLSPGRILSHLPAVHNEPQEWAGGQEGAGTAWPSSLLFLHLLFSLSLSFSPYQLCSHL